MARSLTLFDKNMQMHDYPVATLYFDRLAMADPDFITNYVHEFDGSDNGNLVPSGMSLFNSELSPSQQNLTYFVFSKSAIVPAPADSAYLDSSMADLVRPDNDIDDRIVDFTNFSTGERLHAGDSYSLCFSGEESYSQPPATITTSLDYWKKYTSGGKDYYERTNTWSSPTDKFYRSTTLTNYLTTAVGVGENASPGENIAGCSLFIYDTSENAWTGFDPKGLADSYATKNLDLAAYVTNGQPRGSTFNGGYSDPYDVSYFGLMSSYIEPGPPNTYNVELAPIKMPINSENDPYNYEGVATQDAKILGEVSVQLVYTEINEKAYIGLMLMKWQGNTLVAMNGSLYPDWFWGYVSGQGGDPDTPDPGEENDGPDADDDDGNIEGSYTITQSPPGAINAESSWLPYARTTQSEGGYHVYVLDDVAVGQVYDDFWGSRLEPEKMAAGIVRFGMIPNYFYPIAANTNPVVAEGITYGNYAVRVPDEANAWHINERVIVDIPKMWYFDTESGLDRIYGNYLDFEPYTDIVIHVPFCGQLEIPPSKCIGGSITVNLTVNVENGDMVAQIHCESSSKIKTSRTKGKGELLQTDYYLNGNCFCELPIVVTANTALQFGLKATEGLIKLGTAAALFAGGVGGVAFTKQPGNAGLVGTGAVSDVTQLASLAHPNVANAGGTVNANLIAPKKCFIEITRVAELADGKYKKISGTQTLKAKRLGDINGFTKCVQVLRTSLTTTDGDDGKVTSNTQELTFNGSSAELSEIKRILQDGVIL